MNINSLIRMIGSTLIRGGVYRTMRRIPAGGVIALAVLGIVFYMIGSR